MVSSGISMHHPGTPSRDMQRYRFYINKGDESGEKGGGTLKEEGREMLR
jgi:hypothetical protein